MFSKHKPENTGIHHVSTYRPNQSHRGILQYWPILLFVLLSALTQTLGRFF